MGLLLGSYFEKVITLSTPERIPTVLSAERVDVVLLDMNFSAAINTGNEGLFWLSKIKEQVPDLPGVLFTAYADIELAVKAVKEGATDFVVKPWDNAKLVATLLSAYRLRESQNEVKQLKEEKNALKNQLNSEPSMLWGSSPEIMQVYNLVCKVAKTDANILLTGENGTGKEMIAREIHRLSNRSHEVMISVDMGAVTETLFESELFGHEKGAFTSAIKQRKGKFEQADGGTLFLDEIGDMSLSAQAKVLRALQENRICRVGSDKDIEVNVRVVAATNKNLWHEIELGNFREDLYHRLSVIVVRVPTLKERAEDIPALTDYFIQKICAEYGMEQKKIEPKALDELCGMEWPGNIRELRNVVERLIILSDKTITLEDVNTYAVGTF